MSAASVVFWLRGLLTIVSVSCRVVARTQASVDSKRGLGSSAVFVGRKRFAVLKGNEIIVKNLKNEEVKRCAPPGAVDRLFAGPTGTLLLRADDRITLYDIQQRRALAELQVAQNPVRSRRFACLCVRSCFVFRLSY
jgi:hypothetical protein